MFCEHCGAGLKDGAKHCEYCGASVDKVKTATNQQKVDEVKESIDEANETLKSVVGKYSVLSIIGLLFAVFMPLVGLIISIIAYKQANGEEKDTSLAKAGIIVSAVFMVIYVVGGIFTFNVFNIFFY